jgi:hypothetical protein
MMSENTSDNDKLSRDDVDIEVMIDEGEPDAVFVKFTGFEDDEEAEEYAEFLANTLPLLLFQSRTIQ